MRPSEYFGWSRLDRGLAEGLLEYEGSLGDHGHPMWEATDIANDGRYEVVRDVDHAKAAIDTHRADTTKKPMPGERLRVVLVPDDEDDDPHTPQALGDEALA